MEHANYINTLYQTSQNNLYTANTSIILPVFLFLVSILYFKNLRQILEKIVEENERTLRLTLMLPINLVGDIESIKKMLHLDQVYDIPELAALNDGSGSLGSSNFSPLSAKPKLVEKLNIIDENETSENLQLNGEKIKNWGKEVFENVETDDLETPVNNINQLPDENSENNFTKKVTKQLLPRMSSLRKFTASSEGIRKSVALDDEKPSSNSLIVVSPISKKSARQLPTPAQNIRSSKIVVFPDEEILDDIKNRKKSQTEIENLEQLAEIKTEEKNEPIVFKE
ncbi:hypothetical protein HK096_000556 [Nowakowskiella sp. JEL0078]|nr:hypothetical protein HK096_000556 [Nowakowskiella sp. JEL0078]